MNLTIIAIAIIGAAELVLLILRVRHFLRSRHRILEPVAQPLLVAAPETPKRKRGRPRKTETVPKPKRHYYLPATITMKQINKLEDLFKKHQNKRGDRLVLHIPGKDGPEQEIEVPYLIHWNDALKDNIGKELGGWS